ncbi:uncharacterized protein PHALS_15375 [Plasmopara halstedii]|uniref:Uncharacterized protein n=1 Tax=Plasmopara halstedii TaxID=4781 RepID=A0A0P1A5H9_PLAHL|nr:uncharacterized protein PHALS_15375 [Plasmopara halstedii]CEG35364.1 hypothetical protein PHALS_15375 [Plasmopara halstedii]|eukprot:XP_024571733.1 hypothetical protein PHALS_15375 [Plasmopara halstedii]
MILSVDEFFLQKVEGFVREAPQFSKLHDRPLESQRAGRAAFWTAHVAETHQVQAVLEMASAPSALRKKLFS